MEPRGVVHFDSPAAFGWWLERHHARRDELWVGYWKKSTGRPSLTWPESVDEALCHGWIDGIRKTVDAASYTVRFTPRRPGSVWSAINIRKAKALIEAGRMRERGLAAFRARRDDRSAVYSFEQRKAPRLSAAHARRFKANRRAWAFFATRSAAYVRRTTWWIVSAKQEATRLRRLDVLIARSAAGLPIPGLPSAPEARRGKKPPAK